MTPRTERKMRAKMKRVWKQAVQARKAHNRAVTRFKKLQRQFRRAA